jgi:hypothetical protein
MEDGETTELEAAGREMSPEPPVSFAKVQNAVILSGLRKVKTEDVVVQHLELLLALSAKNPDLIDQFSFFFLFLFLDICHHLGLNCLCFYLFVCDSPKNIHQLVPIISTDASPSPTIRQ